MIHSIVDVDGVELNVFSVHFVWTPNMSVNDYQRNGARFIQDYTKDMDNVLLCGDFNTPYRSEIYDMLVEGF